MKFFDLEMSSYLVAAKKVKKGGRAASYCEHDDWGNCVTAKYTMGSSMSTCLHESYKNCQTTYENIAVPKDE
jgi:hypothetical protein